MDEESQIIKENDLPWEIEQIPDDQILYRQIIASKRKGNRPKKYPPESHFSLRDDEDSLSFNWDKYIDVIKNFKLIGITFSAKGDFLQYDGFVIYKYEVRFLKAIDKFNKLLHTPNFFGAPSPVGQPNNKSHVSLYYDVDDIGVRTQLSDYCQDNIDYCRCEFDVSSLKEEINQLRLRNNHTPYHNLWEFED